MKSHNTLVINALRLRFVQPSPSPFYHITSSKPFVIPQFPYPLVDPGVAIDLQEAIFDAMGPL